MRLSRRTALTAPLPLLGALRQASLAASAPDRTVRIDVAAPHPLRFDRRDAGIVGVYDVDWLTTPGFTRLLDNLAASPGAFSGVRFFGALTAGQPERLQPEGGGAVWTAPDAPIDLTATLDALAALTARGLTPVIALGFFPPAVSPSPVQPPTGWDAWQTLVRTFFETLAADPRFGPEAIAGWWFEAWNEPNEGRFWSGDQDDYLALYRATSQAVAATGLPIRLGGPAIAYKPQQSPADGLPWVDRFLRFVAADPDLKLDFLSIHRKGTVADDPPDPRRLYHAAGEVAALALAIDPERFAGLTIVNDEADEKVGFEVPYAPRMDAANAAWLAAAAGIAATLTERHRDQAGPAQGRGGLRFVMAADNANLQLVEAPFDGRRSIMTLARPLAVDATAITRADPTAGRSGAPPWAPVFSSDPLASAQTHTAATQTDLLKLPAYGFYEMLRLLGDRQLPIAAGREHLFPATDLYHLATLADTHVGVLLTHYPAPGAHDPAPHALDYVVSALPWPEVNVALFRIDTRTSNAYTAAGGSPANPFPVPDPSDFAGIRQAQELALARPIARRVAVPDGSHRESLTLDPYATLCLWLTPTSDAVPAAPAWLEVTDEPAGALLRWEPTTDPAFLTYELFSMEDDAPTARLTPETMRAALWVESGSAPGRRYAVRTVSASGIASPLTPSPA